MEILKKRQEIERAFMDKINVSFGTYQAAAKEYFLELEKLQLECKHEEVKDGMCEFCNAKI